MKKVIFVFFLIILVFSCKTEKEVFLDKNTFSELSAKILIIHYSNLKPVQKAKIVKQLLLNSNVSAQAYLKTKDHYAANPYYWEEVYKKMNVYLSSVKPDSIANLFTFPPKPNDNQRTGK